MSEAKDTSEVSSEVSTRANRDGHPCPPWCAVAHVTDTSGGYRYTFHGSEAIRVEVPGKMRHQDDAIFVRALQGGYGNDAPQVAVSATRHGADGPPPHAWIVPREAEHLAAVIEMLAAATPGQHRELAAAIRQAAAQITGTGDDRPSR